MINKTYTEFCKELNTIAVTLEAFEKKPDVFLSQEFQEAINALESLARSTKYAALEHEILHAEKFKATFAKLRDIFSSYETYLETQQAVQYITTDAKQSHEYIERTQKYSSLEVEKSNITKDSKVVFVGSGPFPETALAISELTGCEITCIDINPVALSLSQRIIEKHKNIHLQLADGKQFDYKSFTHVIIGALAIPKNEILHRICTTSPENITVLVRAAKGLRSLMYETIYDLFLDHFELIDRIQGETIMETIVMKHHAH